MTQESAPHSFVQYLLSLPEQGDRAALAALRRGLGQPPGAAPEMFRYVIPHLPAEPHPDQEAAYYLVAALFAFHPQNTLQGNMGAHMAAAIHDESSRPAVERRFTALLAAHPDDLPAYLRQAVSFLKAKEIPVNWNQLFYDLQYWSHPDYGPQIRRRWADDFWRISPSSNRKS